MMCRSFILSAILVTSVLLSIPLTSAAQTTVDGDIVTTTWTAANSPYRITGWFAVVPGGNTLTIEAGVDVIFDADARLLVQGAIRVHGTESDSVRFTRGDADQWRGIQIKGGDSSYFAYTRISDGNARGERRDGWGGGLRITGEDTQVSMIHSVISANSAEHKGGGLYILQGTATLTNCILWANSASAGAQIYRDVGTVNVRHSNIQGGIPDGVADGGGNIGADEVSDDPLFVDAANGDFRLRERSPCIGTGEGGADMGAVPFDADVSVKPPAQPAQFSIAQNAPNPFNPRTSLRFSIAEAGVVRFAIYDVNGRLVRTLVNSNLSAGHHEVIWDARDNVGRAVASGVYVYRLTSGADVAVRRMTLVR